MRSLADVLSPDFGRSWHEAVAIVQEAATLWQPGLSIPGPEDILLDDDGILTFGFGDESSENPVAALAALLQGLLKGIDAPAALKDLVAENATSQPAHASMSTFTRALAFFERPNRANDLRAVAGRLRGFREKSAADVEFQRLRERITGPPEPEVEQPSEEKPKRRKPVLTPRQQVLVATGICVLVFGFLGFKVGLQSRVGSLVGKAENGVQDMVSAGLTQLGMGKVGASAAPASTPASPAQPETPVEAPRAASGDVPVRTTGPAKSAAPARNQASQTATNRSRRVEPSIQTVTPPTPLPMPATPVEAAPTAAAPVKPLPPPPVPPAPTPSILAPDGIFSSAYPEVKAPALLRQQLPREPAPSDDTGFFDMVIDEAGNVAQIKLISPNRRYHDRMLVAAAKAWKFKPATLNGQPVKYRLRIPIILTGMPGRP